MAICCPLSACNWIEVSEELATEIAKIAVVDNRNLIRGPRQEEPQRMHLIFRETRVIGLRFCRW